MADDEVETGVLKGKWFPWVDEGEGSSGEVLQTPVYIVGINVDATDRGIGVFAQVLCQSSTSTSPIQNGIGFRDVH